MTIQAQLPSFSPPARAPSLLDLLGLKLGQTVAATVLGTTAEGLTQISIGGQTINVSLPQFPLPGTVLQFRAEASGQGLQLALITQSPPEAAPQPPPPVAPPPPAVSAPLPVPPASGSDPASMQREASQPGMTAQPQARPQPSPATATPPQPAAAPPRASESVPQPAGPATPPNVATRSAPSSPQLPVATILNAELHDTGQQAQLLIVGKAPSAPVQLTQEPVAPPPPSTAERADIAPPARLPAGSVVTVAVEGSGQTGQLLILDKPPAQPMPSPVGVQPRQPTPQRPVGTEIKLEVQLDGRPQTVHLTVIAGSANETARPATAQAALPPIKLPNGPMPETAPAAPKGVLAQMARADIGQQDSVAPLLARLVGLQAQSAQLPRPVAQAAQAVLATPLDLAARPLSGESLKQAALNSGVFLEAKLASGTLVSPAQGDLKAALLQLRSALMAWLGPEAAVAPTTGRRPAPPLRGAVPRSEATVMRAPPDPEAPKDAARPLLGHTEAALSRVRLSQLASLPDVAPTAVRAATPAEWNLEIPLLLGQELCMAQFQIAGDGKSEQPDQRRGWAIRFSLSFSEMGEVGAQVSLNGKATSVSLWADRPETADAINAMLPELAPALAAKGLSLEAIGCRVGAPRQPVRAAGKFVDSLS